MPSIARPPVIVSNAKPPVQRKPKGPERKWTSREDEVLITAVNAYSTGEKINWIKIAELIEGRSNKACRKRWIHSLNPTLRKGRWTIQEDELLLKAIRKHGHCWHKVAKYLPGRTDDQAAKRFREKLDPGIAKTPWTEEEDRVLLDMWKKVGCRWNLISRELNGRPAVHCRNRYASLKRIHKALDSDGRGEAPSTADPFVDPVNTPTLSTPSLSPNCSPCSTPPRQPSPSSPFPDAKDTDFASNVGFPSHPDSHELRQIEEINSLLVGGEQRGLSQQSMPTLSSTLYHLRLNETRPHHFCGDSTHMVKISLSDHMRILPPGHLNPPRRASAPQPGFHTSAVTPQPMPRQLPFLYSRTYPESSFACDNTSDITQHLMLTPQQPDTTSTFDVSSPFSPFPGMSSSRPTTSGSDFSNTCTEPTFFSSGPTSPSTSPADDLRFGLYQDTSLVKMENGAASVDLVSWGNHGFLGLDGMGGFDTFEGVPPC